MLRLLLFEFDEGYGCQDAADAEATAGAVATADAVQAADAANAADAARCNSFQDLLAIIIYFTLPQQKMPKDPHLFAGRRGTQSVVCI